MCEISISKSLGRTNKKNYTHLYPEYGYEMGVGFAGEYPGHTHLFFNDIIFSPNGIYSTDTYGRVSFGELFVVPSRTYFQSVRLGDFFFMKFCSDNKFVVLPDKVDTIMSEGAVESHSNEAQIKFDWFKKNDSVKESILFFLKNKVLGIEIGSSQVIKVTA